MKKLAWPRCNQGQKLVGPKKRIGAMTAENIVDHARVDPVTGCWNWKRFKLPTGYGLKTQHKKREYAHRLAYTLAKGPIPSGHEVRHSCDNPQCVNPAHLSTGTRQDNVDDMTNRGRHAKGDMLPQTVLSEATVIRIRELYRQGMTQTEIGDLMGLDHRAIWSIVHRKIWKHI